MRETWDVLLATHRHRVSLDGVAAHAITLDDGTSLRRAIREKRPDLIVHTAGLTDVDRCETDPSAARHANAGLARCVAEAAAAESVPLVHISTDHLFSGDRARVPETETPKPINEYARSKRLAEKWVLDAHPHPLIIRTNFYGWGNSARKSFSDWIIYRLRAGEQIAAFEDVYYTPILADRAVRWTHELVSAGATGIFNVCGDERVSKYDFAIRVADVFELPTRLIRRSSVTQAALRAPRPADMSLDNSKACRAVNQPARTIIDDLHDLRAQEDAGRREVLMRAVSPGT